jgi:hypothetical protein
MIRSRRLSSFHTLAQQTIQHHDSPRHRILSIPFNKKIQRRRIFPARLRPRSVVNPLIRNRHTRRIHNRLDVGRVRDSATRLLRHIVDLENRVVALRGRETLLAGVLFKALVDFRGGETGFSLAVWMCSAFRASSKNFLVDVFVVQD